MIVRPAMNSVMRTPARASAPPDQPGPPDPEERSLLVGATVLGGMAGSFVMGVLTGEFTGPTEVLVSMAQGTFVGGAIGGVIGAAVGTLMARNRPTDQDNASPGAIGMALVGAGLGIAGGIVLGAIGGAYLGHSAGNVVGYASGAVIGGAASYLFTRKFIENN